MPIAYSYVRLMDIFCLGFQKRTRDIIQSPIRFSPKKIFLFLIFAILAWPGSGDAAYWNVFNAEGESLATAQFVTYATLTDMLNDTNRIGVFTPSEGGAGENIVGSGADIIRQAVVPEPGSLFLLCTGLLGFGLSRAGRRTSRSLFRQAPDLGPAAFSRPGCVTL